MKPIKIIYPVILFVLGSWSMFHGDWWVWFGVIMWILGAVVAGWIVIVGFWEEKTRYYDSVSEVLKYAREVDIEKMAALGFRNGEIKESLHVDLHEGTRSRHFDLPVSMVKLQPLARGLLNGQPFSERRWAEVLTASEFRALRASLRSKGLIEPVSDKDTRQGFILTDAGRAVMEQILPSPTDGDGIKRADMGTHARLHDEKTNRQMSNQ